MIEPLKIPQGAALILSDGMSITLTISDQTSHRTDLMKGSSGKSVATEMFNNRLSNVSPISAEKGTEYIMGSVEFKAYFGR